MIEPGRGSFHRQTYQEVLFEILACELRRIAVTGFPLRDDDGLSPLPSDVRGVPR